MSNTSFLPRRNRRGRLYRRPGDHDECQVFRQALGPVDGRYTEAFLAAPSPGIVASIVRNRHYATEDAYLAALGEALRTEYEAIVAHGFLLQLDCPDLALERHCSYRDRPLAEFIDFGERVVATINQAIRNIPRDRVRLHVCWGNYEGPHDSDVPLRDILPVILQAKVGGFVLPSPIPRHAHEFRLFERMPLAEDQLLVAGVIDTLTNFIEHPETVADRIERVAAVIGDPTRVLAGTDCGFDTAAGRGRLTPDIVWAKLRALREARASPPRGCSRMRPCRRRRDVLALRRAPAAWPGAGHAGNARDRARDQGQTRGAGGRGRSGRQVRTSGQPPSFSGRKA